MSEPRLILKREDWPRRDRAAWDALFVEGSIFDERGPCLGWSEGSRRKREQSYGHWLGFLRNAGVLDGSAAPADRFSRELVLAFLEATQARVSLISTSGQVSDLYTLARAFDSSRDWFWFKRLADRLRHQAGRWQLKPRAGVSAEEVLNWALAEIEAAEAMESEDGRMIRSVRFRDGLMIALLIARPLRLRAFIGMEIGTQLVPSGDGFLLRFRAEDMKDHKAREFDLPEFLNAAMRRYLDYYRPALLRGKETPALWVSRRRGPLSRDGFAQHLWHVTGHAFGEALRLHAFRHIAATSIAEEDPAHVNIIASLLGHATLAMAEKHYNRASGVKAAARYQDVIRAKRREARQRARTRSTLRANAASRDVAD